MRVLGALRTLGEIVFLLSISGVLLLRTVISPWNSGKALLTWAVTFAVFALAVAVRASMHSSAYPPCGMARLLKRSYNSLLPIIAGFTVLFTLNALHIAPLDSQTLNDRPDMLVPILFLHVLFTALVFVEFYLGQDLLKIGVAVSLWFVFLIFGGASIVGFGSLLILILMYERAKRFKEDRFDYAPSAFDIPMLAFLAVCTLSTACGFSLDTSSVSLLLIVAPMSGALLIGSTTTTRRDLLRLVFLVAMVGVFLAVLGLVKLSMLVSTFGLGFAIKNRLWLPLINPNGIAVHFTLTIPLMLALAMARIRRWLSVVLVIAAIVGVVCLVLSYSKGGVIGFAAAMIAFMLTRTPKTGGTARPRRRFVTVAVIVVGAALIVLISLGEVGQRALERLWDPISLESRSFFWGVADRTVARHPVLGVGLDNTYVHTRIADLVESALEIDIRQNVLSHSHSTYLHIAEGTGVIGLCAFIFLLITVISRGIILLKKMPYGPTWLVMKGVLAGAIGFAIHGFFDLEFASPDLNSALFVYIGLIAAAENVWRCEAKGTWRFTLGARGRSKLLYWCCFGLLAILAVTTQVSMKSVLFCPQLAAHGLTLDPTFFEWLAEEKIQMDQFDEATALYEKAVARKHDYPKYLEKLGWLYWLRGDTTRAQTYFQAAVDFDPLGAIDGEHYSALALFLYAQGEYQRASMAMASAVQTDPKVLQRGIWQYVPRGDEQAGDWMVRREFITYDGKDPASWEALKGLIVNHLKDEVGPASRIIGPDISQILTDLANPRYFRPWLVTAIQERLYERYLDVLATDPLTAKKILLNIGKGYYYAGRSARAESIFMEGLKFFRGDFAFRSALAVLYADEHRYESAAELFSQVGDSYSEGIVWLLAEQYDRAISAFSDLLSHHVEHERRQEHAKALTMIGRVCERQGGPDSLVFARDCYEKALFLSKSAAAYKRLSDVLYELGEDDKAKEMYRKALELNQAGQPLQDEPPETLTMD